MLKKRNGTDGKKDGKGGGERIGLSPQRKNLKAEYGRVML
jgi:hypothetical protein